MIYQNFWGNEFQGHEKALKSNTPGVVTGLAWTPVGRRNTIY